MEDTTMARVAVMELDDHPFYEVVDETIVEPMPMGAYERWIAAVLTLHLGDFLKQHVYTSPTQVRIFVRADELHGEPVLPNFRLPLAALFENAQEME